MHKGELKPLGQVAYETYGECVNNTAHDGQPMPHWDRLKDLQRFAWTQVYLRCSLGPEGKENG